MSLSLTASPADARAITATRVFGWRGLSMLAILVTLVSARWLAHSSGGGLWRDEIHSVTMATRPVDDLFFVLTHDSFPVFWQVLLRGWIGLFGSSDVSVRMLGLLSGLAVIPALWWMARQFGLSFPWWSMLLLGLDPTLIVFGSEARGYSLGIVTMLILIGVSWNTLKQPTAFRWAGLTVAALLAVQSSYTNCFLLAATFIGCGVVAIYRGRYLVCVGFGLIGILAAVTMLPYAMFVLPRLTKLIQPFLSPTTWKTRVNVFRETLYSGGRTRSVVWSLVGIIATLEIYRRVFSWGLRRPSQSESEQNTAMFVATFFWVGSIGFWFYMNYLGVHTANWYYLPFLALLAFTADAGMQLWLRRQPRMEPWAIGTALVASLFVCGDVGATLPLRFTAADLVANELNERVREGDLVVVTPWYFNISFDRYYHGSAEWISIPDIDHHSLHNNHQALLDRVIPLPPAEAIQAELKKIDAVLQAGGTVWWVGHKLQSPLAEQPVLYAVPYPTHGWNEYAYFTTCQQLALARMLENGVTGTELPVDRPKLINVHEDPVVFQFQPNRSESKLTSSE